MPAIKSDFTYSRRLPIGAEVAPEGKGVHFRVWAPAAQTVAIILTQSSQVFRLDKEEGGYFSGFITQAQDEMFYAFQLNEGPEIYPDPASRFQPEGPTGPSQIIDPAKFLWRDQDWKGIVTPNQVIYEMHIGTFTQEGTFASAQSELPELAKLGITMIEMMPICTFPGNFGWGYDGVNLFSPYHRYGNPNEVRAFIDHAHQLGIAVILDVVYNHFGPDGNLINAFSPHYITKNYSTDWGDALNFDGAESKPVREFFIANSGYWIDEFHFDGLRFDATQNIYDSSEIYILAEISQYVRKIAHPRKIYLVAENEAQDTILVDPIEAGGCGLDALWNDDFHHAARVRLTGSKQAYYRDYTGTPQEFISTVKHGYLYQGQWYLWQNKNRGSTALHLPPPTFVNFIQNHDQIANSAHGLRIHKLSHPGDYRAMTALTLLAPSSPMLFQGQEFGSSAPFYYFADHREELARCVVQGRKESFKPFSAVYTPEILAQMPDPSNPETFRSCKLNFKERDFHSSVYALHSDLIHLRQSDPIFSSPRIREVDGAVLSTDAFLLRFFGEVGDARLLIVNFGADLNLSPAPHPLFAPPKGKSWKILWSSEHPRYDGGGVAPLLMDSNFCSVGHSAIVLISTDEIDDHNE